jgi:hypothetical protein
MEQTNWFFKRLESCSPDHLSVQILFQAKKFLFFRNNKYLIEVVWSEYQGHWFHCCVYSMESQAWSIKREKKNSTNIPLSRPFTLSMTFVYCL